VYILRCRGGSFYTGVSNDLPRRLALHRRGKGSAYTRSHLPVTLVHSEAASGRGPALAREAALKRLSHAEKAALVKRSPRRAA
jgi:putative endonuclease